jgi:hypothetical protein
MLSPSSYGNLGAFANFCFDAEIVHEAFAATEAEPHSAGRGIAIFESQFDIRDAWPLILKDQPQSRLRPDTEDFDRHGPAFSVIQSVSGKFTRSGHQFGLVHQGKPQFNRPMPHPLPGEHNIIRRS